MFPNTRRRRKKEHNDAYNAELMMKRRNDVKEKYGVKDA